MFEDWQKTPLFSLTLQLQSMYPAGVANEAEGAGASPFFHSPS